MNKKCWQRCKLPRSSYFLGKYCESVLDAPTEDEWSSTLLLSVYFLSGYPEMRKVILDIVFRRGLNSQTLTFRIIGHIESTNSAKSVCPSKGRVNGSISFFWLGIDANLPPQLKVFL